MSKEGIIFVKKRENMIKFPRDVSFLRTNIRNAAGKAAFQLVRLVPVA
jgi:hypothetical protein